MVCKSYFDFWGRPKDMNLGNIGYCKKTVFISISYILLFSNINMLPRSDIDAQGFTVL